MSAPLANAGFLVPQQTAAVLLAHGELLKDRYELRAAPARSRRACPRALFPAERGTLGLDRRLRGDAGSSQARRHQRARNDPPRPRDGAPARLGINELAITHRHFGRGFSPLASGLPESPLYRSVPYLGMLQAYCDTLEFWLEQLRDHPLSADPVDLSALVAAERNA